MQNNVFINNDYPILINENIDTSFFSNNQMENNSFNKMLVIVDDNNVDKYDKTTLITIKIPNFPVVYAYEKED